MQRIDCERMHAKISIIQCVSNQIAKIKNPVNRGETLEFRYPACQGCEKGIEARKQLTGDAVAPRPAGNGDSNGNGKNIWQVDEKECTRCQKTKPASEFEKMRSRRDGLDFICRECRQGLPITLSFPEDIEREKTPGKTEADAKPIKFAIILDAELHAGLIQVAREEERTPEAQVRWLIKQAVRRKPIDAKYPRKEEEQCTIQESIV